MGCNTKRVVANKKRKISKQEIKEIKKLCNELIETARYVKQQKDKKRNIGSS